MTKKRKPRPRVETDARPDPGHACVAAFAHELAVAVVDPALHDPSTPSGLEWLRSTHRALCEVFAAGVASPLALEVQDGALRWDARQLPAASLQAGRLVRLLEERAVRRLTFTAPIDADSIGRFLALLVDPRERGAFRAGAAGRLLAERGARGIAVEVDLAAPTSPQSAARTGTGQVLREYQRLTEAVQDSHVAARRGKELEMDLARGLVERTVARMGEAPSDLLALSVYDDIDRFTVGHSVRVALLALEVARAARADEQQLLLVGTAGLLHDVGKSRVPQEVLFKQGRLDDEEWRAMAEHPRLGAAILIEQEDVHPSAVGAAFCHHMAPGRRGYPDPIAGFEPSSISRLIRVCDVFEALTAARPYKRDLTPLEAMAIMNRQADGFDERWLRFFFKTIGVYPVGTRLRLDTGERGLVVRHGPTPAQPVVRLEPAASEPPIEPGAGTEFVVGVPNEGITRHVAAVIRRRDGAEFEDASERAVVPQHACIAGGHDSCSHS